MSIRSLFLLSLVAGSLLPMLASAQTYARQEGDTLRYAESTVVKVRVMTPQGEIPVTLNTESALALMFSGEDTLKAWYTALSATSESVLGNERPSTDQVLNVPFTIHFSPRGATRTLEAPVPSPALRRINDVRRQFDDFFLILPEEELRVGFSWLYEIAVADSAAEEGKHAFTKSGLLTVMGDTLVGGRSGLKITGDLDATLSTSTFIPEQGITIDNQFAGVEHNVYVFSPSRGVLLLHDRTAALGGTTTFGGGAMPTTTMQQDVSYTSTIRLDD